jgi:hypothetical protein
MVRAIDKVEKTGGENQPVQRMRVGVFYGLAAGVTLR